MKQRLLLLALTALLAASCATSQPLAGKWKGADAEGGEVVLFLNQNGDFEAVAKGERLKGKWKVDQEAEPDRIDLIFETSTFSSICKMQGDSLLIEPVGEDGKVPSKFTSKATQYERQQ